MGDPNGTARDAEFQTVGISPAMVLMDVYPGDVFAGLREGSAGREPKAFVWGVADDGRLLMSEMYDNDNMPARFAIPADRAGWRRIETNDLARRKVARGR